MGFLSHGYILTSFGTGWSNGSAAFGRNGQTAEFCAIPSLKQGTGMFFCRGWTRVLLPFHLSGAGSIDSALRALSPPWLGAPAGLPEKIAHSEYFGEYLPHVCEFLFHGIGETGCRYLKLDQKSFTSELLGPAEVWTINMWPDESKGHLASPANGPSLRGLQVLGINADDPVWVARRPFGDRKHRLAMQVALDRNSGIEIWVSQLGAGVVCLSFTCDPESDQSNQPDAFFEGLLELNHAASTAHRSIWLRPSMQAARSGPRHRTAAGAASDEAAGNSKATEPATHLHQLLRQLLKPLWGQSGVRLMFETRGVVFTAVEIRRSCEPDSEFTAELIPKLSHLAQIHPPSHPGEGKLQHSQTIWINDRHVCQMSLAGAAHASIVLADDAAASEYDQKRLRRIQMQYFPGFLLAQVQRLCLQRIFHESTDVSREADSAQRVVGRRCLFEKVLRFGLEGEFIQACWRPTLEEHHKMAQRVCEVAPSLRAVRETMGDFNRMATERSLEQQREEVERAERMTQILEVFVVTFYSVELAHILGESFGFGHAPTAGWSLVFVAIATFSLVAILVTSQWLRRRRVIWTVVCLFLLTSVIHGAFLGANWWLSAHSPPTGRAGEA